MGRARIAGMLCLCLALVACGRPLTPNETAFAAVLKGRSFDPAAARLHEGLATGPVREIPARPRLTCQDRIFPPPRGQTVRVATGAMAIFHDVHVRRDLYAEDFLAGYPDSLYLPDAMLFAHEMVHVWQWQNRARTGYHPLRAAFEHLNSPDPYLFDPGTTRDYLDFGYEQQGAIMEEYVCCRALAPDAARTARLHAMLAQVFDLPPPDSPLARDIYLPWRDVQIAGICD